MTLTRTFCEICDAQLGPYDGWHVEIQDRRRGKPESIERIGLICDQCAAPVIDVVRSPRVAEVAA